MLNVTKQYIGHIRQSSMIKRRMLSLAKVAVKQRSVDAINKEIEKTATDIVDKTNPNLIEKMRQEFAEQGCEFTSEQFKAILVELVKLICIGIITAVIVGVTAVFTFGISFIAGIIFMIYRGWYKFYKNIDEKHAMCALTSIQMILTVPGQMSAKTKAAKATMLTSYMYLVKKGYIKNRVLGKMIFDVLEAMVQFYVK